MLGPRGAAAAVASASILASTSAGEMGAAASSVSTASYPNDMIWSANLFPAATVTSRRLELPPEFLGGAGGGGPELVAPPCEGGREVKPDSDAAAADAASLSLSVSHRGRLYPAPSTFVPRRSAAVGAVARVTEGPAAEGATPEGLAAVVRPIMGAEEWAGLTGSEFTVPSAVEGLAATGIAVASMDTADTYVDWSPNKETAALLGDEGDDLVGAISSGRDGTVLLWTGKFRSAGRGSDVPAVRTVYVLPMPPRDFAALLMDSSRVMTYNKMSLGRTDLRIMQVGIDTKGGDFGGVHGEAKIARNLTQPPMSKKKMDFLTMMHARPLRKGDNPGRGFLGGGGDDGTGFLVVSRAVNDSSPGAQALDWIKESVGDGEERSRSEILLGVNLIRPVPGEPNKSEVTAITHCNSPGVPIMIASKLGVKGAVGFVKDIRELYQ